MRNGVKRLQRGQIFLPLLASLLTGCGFNGATVTVRPDLARNAKPVDAAGEGPVVGTPPPVIFPPIPAPQPGPKDPAAVFESRMVGEYVVAGRIFEISPTGQTKRKRAITLDVKTFEEIQVNQTLRQYEDQTGYQVGYATIRNSSRGGFQPVRFGVRLQEDSHGRKTLYFSEGSARRLMRALLPAEAERGELDLRAGGGLVLAQYGVLPLVAEAAVVAGAAAIPMAFSAVSGPFIPVFGLAGIFAAEHGGICNPSRAGAIRMLNRELLWRSWSTPNLIQHPECR